MEIMSADKSKIKLVVTYPNDEVRNKIIGLARSFGWVIYNDEPGVKPGWEALVFNRHGYEDGTLIWTSDVRSLLSRGPEWKELNSASDWDRLVAILQGEPEFDESPLPYDMKHELIEETRNKFNLSPEQWLEMPLMVKEALAGCEVKRQELEYKWHPKETPPVNSTTVFLTIRPEAGRNSATNDNAIGYWNGNEFAITQGRISPRRVTHWCPMPGSNVLPGEQAEEDD